MDEKEMITIQNTDGSLSEVELVTYLVSDDHTKTYLVYSKGEKTDVGTDEVIYISGIVKDEGEALKLYEIIDDSEWAEVLKYLKKIANA